MRSRDDEIEAMTRIAEALSDLSEEERGRVLAWAESRFGRSPAMQAADTGGAPPRTPESTAWPEFVDLFDAAGARTDAERALVAGFWLQVLKGAADFPSQQANDLLKDVGHGVANITDALAKLQRRKPALVRQTSKSGRSQQARKRYKLTSSGIADVQRMVHRSTNE